MDSTIKSDTIPDDSLDMSFNCWNSSLDDSSSHSLPNFTVWNTPPVQKGDVLPDIYNMAIKIAAVNNASADTANLLMDTTDSSVIDQMIDKKQVLSSNPNYQGLSNTNILSIKLGETTLDGPHGSDKVSDLACKENFAQDNMDTNSPAAVGGPYSRSFIKYPLTSPLPNINNSCDHGVPGKMPMPAYPYHSFSNFPEGPAKVEESIVNYYGRRAACSTTQSDAGPKTKQFCRNLNNQWATWSCKDNVALANRNVGDKMIGSTNLYSPQSCTTVTKDVCSNFNSSNSYSKETAVNVSNKYENKTGSHAIPSIISDNHIEQNLTNRGVTDCANNDSYFAESLSKLENFWDGQPMTAANSMKLINGNSFNLTSNSISQVTIQDENIAALPTFYSSRYKSAMHPSSSYVHQKVVDASLPANTCSPNNRKISDGPPFSTVSSSVKPAQSSVFSPPHNIPHPVSTRDLADQQENFALLNIIANLSGKQVHQTNEIISNTDSPAAMLPLPFLNNAEENAFGIKLLHSNQNELVSSGQRGQPPYFPGCNSTFCPPSTPTQMGLVTPAANDGAIPMMSLHSQNFNGHQSADLISLMHEVAVMQRYQYINEFNGMQHGQHFKITANLHASAPDWDCINHGHSSASPNYASNGNLGGHAMVMPNIVGGGGGSMVSTISCSPNSMSTPNKGCVFCKNNNYHSTFYKSHSLKDERGHCACPVLRTYVCPLCRGTGDAAHTLKYCPLNTVTRGDPISAGLPPGKVTNWRDVASKMAQSNC